jgi:hypothetical protein
VSLNSLKISNRSLGLSKKPCSRSTARNFASFASASASFQRLGPFSQLLEARNFFADLGRVLRDRDRFEQAFEALPLGFFHLLEIFFGRQIARRRKREFLRALEILG